MLSAKEIKECIDNKPVKVEVPEWGGDIYMSCASGAQMDEFQALLSSDSTKPIESICHVLVNSIVDEKGKPLFAASDAEWLKDKNGNVLIRLMDEFNTINGLNGDAVDEAKND